MVVYMIFKNKQKPLCAMCEFSKSDEDKLYCTVKDREVSEDDSCRKYKYDIFKKKVIPKKKIDFDKYSQEDFRL